MICDKQQQIHCATSVLASEDVSSDRVTEQLKMAQSIPTVSQLEVEGLVLNKAGQTTIFPVLESMIFSEEKSWKSIRFVDAVSPNDFAKWQATKEDLMMRVEMNDSYLPLNWRDGKMAWKATLEFPPGVSLRKIVKAIENDPDIFDVVAKKTPESTVLEVTAGWSTRKTQVQELLKSLKRTSSMRRPGEKRRGSERSIPSCISISSASSASHKSKQLRKRAKKTGKKGSPDYNWETGAYTSLSAQ
jgi:hypothetical protein